MSKDWEGKVGWKKRGKGERGNKTIRGNKIKQRIWKSVISEDEDDTSDLSEHLEEKEDLDGGERGGRGGDQNKTSKTTNNQNNTNKLTNTKKDKTQQLLLGLQYLINSAVLFTREHLKAGGRIDNVAKLICKSTIARLAHLAPTVLTNSSFPENRFSEEDLKQFAKKVKTFGASGKRTHEQTTAAAAHAAELVSSLPKNSIQIWPDGSKTGKGAHGPTGAGAMIMNTGNEIPTHQLTYHLGVSTNQVAEIWAVGGALETVRGDNYADDNDIHIFSDSEFAINCISGYYASRIHHNIVKHVIALVALFPKNSIHFHHVAGHAGIPGNEAADALAKEGAEYSERSNFLHDLPYIAKTFGFNHQLISSSCSCNGNFYCSSCTGSEVIILDRPMMKSRNLQSEKGNGNSSNYSSSTDDLNEELILPNVFREGHTVCDPSLIFNK